MADRSAAALVDAVLADPQQAVEPLSRQLALDAPLLLWVVCQAARRDAFRPSSIIQAGQWLQKHLIEVLRWEPRAEGGLEVLPQQEAERWADRVAQVVQVSELAALLAAPDGETAAEEAFLLGLLDDPSQWFELAEGPRPAHDSDYLPGWLLAVGQEPVGRQVAEAARILTGNGGPAPPDFDRQACRQRGEEVRQRWLETVGGPVARLPVLTARLARLQQLEDRFREVLETEKLEALAEFAAGAGHEVNNPLAIIGGRAQLLLRGEPDPERRRELALINAQVKRAHEMIADIRLFARPPRPEPEKIELVGLVDTIIGELAPQASEQAISLARSGDDGPLELEADPAQLNVALRAVCKNALEAIGHDGHVEITLGQLPGRVQIRVSDNGPGITPEHRRHLFDPFYSARQAGRGLGFGLSKCWRIVHLHGGRIDVESQPGQGAAFTITLPERWSG